MSYGLECAYCDERGPIDADGFETCILCGKCICAGHTITNAQGATVCRDCWDNLEGLLMPCGCIWLPEVVKDAHGYILSEGQFTRLCKRHEEGWI